MRLFVLSVLVRWDDRQFFPNGIFWPLAFVVFKQSISTQERDQISEKS